MIKWKLSPHLAGGLECISLTLILALIIYVGSEFIWSTLYFLTHNFVILFPDCSLRKLVCMVLCQPMEKAMAPHSSTLAWKTPWMEEPGGLQSMGSRRVGHDWVTSLSLFTFMHWRRKWQPTPVLLPGKPHGWKSLVGYSPWDYKELDMTEQLHLTYQI